MTQLAIDTRIERAAAAIWRAMALLSKVPTLTWDEVRQDRKKHREMYQTVCQIVALRAGES
jgi:hypothetical protein